MEDIAYKGKIVTPRTGSTDVKLQSCRQHGLIVTAPQLDDLFFFVNPRGQAHHIGIVSGLNPLIGISGNTSPDGLSSNGTGVFTHALSLNASTVFARLPK